MSLSELSISELNERLDRILQDVATKIGYKGIVLGTVAEGVSTGVGVVGGAIEGSEVVNIFNKKIDLPAYNTDSPVALLPAALVKAKKISYDDYVKYALTLDKALDKTPLVGSAAGAIVGLGIGIGINLGIQLYEDRKLYGNISVASKTVNTLLENIFSENNEKYSGVRKVLLRIKNYFKKSRLWRWGRYLGNIIKYIGIYFGLSLLVRLVMAAFGHAYILADIPSELATKTDTIYYAQLVYDHGKIFSDLVLEASSNMIETLAITGGAYASGKGIEVVSKKMENKNITSALLTYETGYLKELEKLGIPVPARASRRTLVYS